VLGLQGPRLGVGELGDNGGLGSITWSHEHAVTYDMIYAYEIEPSMAVCCIMSR